MILASNEDFIAIGNINVSRNVKATDILQR